jgi:molybdate transport system permease protein
MSLKRVATGAVLGLAVLYLGLVLALAPFIRPLQVLSHLATPRVLYATGLSALAATLAVALAFPLAVLGGYALSRIEFPGRKAVDTLLDLPLVASPAALGAMLLIFFSHSLGDWIQTHTVNFVFAFWGVVLAQFMTIAGLATRGVKAAFDAVPSRVENVARSLGANPWQAFRTTTLPMARRGIQVATLLAWAKALGEFGATITLAGTMSMRTETLPVAIYLRLASADLEGAAALILLLMTLGLLALWGIRRMASESIHA